jgi:uncharacterized membrane protein (UPF0127 family)
MRRPSVVLLVALLLGGCSDDGAPRPTSTPLPPATTAASGLTPGIATITTGNGEVEVVVEVATTSAARQRGLMGRTELAANAGMVFLFEEEEVRSFWMKDTLIPLSIAFFDRGGRIVSILDMEPCRTLVCDLYPSGAPASGALEVNQGFFEEHGVRVGDRIDVQVQR